MKTCFKCGKIKKLSMFYKHNRMADGHLNKCMECTKKDVAEHREKNIERIRAYDRERGKLPHRLANVRRITKRYRKLHPEACAAHTLLNYAVRTGKIKRPRKCSMCGSKRLILAHHPDYYKPLDVVWVCQPCHKQIHKEKCAV